MELDVKEWGSRPKIGKGYASDVNGKWCSILQTKKGAYRGDHIHPYDQYTVLLDGLAMVVKQIDGDLVEFPLTVNQVHKTPKDLPHILIALEDTVLYEWWDGPYETEPCLGTFDDYKIDRVGPRD
jgi:oxalate decarboxylase/phosphoglucose isomerase-like protein (cupin superfamily)